jgi:hemerythrin-like domain-containing protein
MIREILGMAEGILQDLHNDHEEVSSLIEQIEESDSAQDRALLFQEMKTKLLAHSKAEEEVLYRRLENGKEEESRSFAFEGTNEHQHVEQQLKLMAGSKDVMGEQWTAQVNVLRELIEHHVEEEEGTGFGCARDEFGKDVLERMASEFQSRKAQLMTEV